MKKLSEVLYSEYLIPIYDYIASQDARERIFDVIVPIVFASVVYFVFLAGTTIQSVALSSILGYTINLLAILIGFTITCVTILTSSSSQSVDLMKKEKSDRKSREGKAMSLYHLILVNFAHVLLMEVFTLGVTLLYSIASSVNRLMGYSAIFLGLTTFLLLHVLVLNVRNITNLYFVLWRITEGETGD
jgi:hypothetical protein